MKALVTGSTGFVGANLCKALMACGWSVRALRRASSRLDMLQDVTVEYAIGDVTEPETLTEAMRSCDVVFHVAAVADYWRQSADKLYRVNVQGTRAVCQAALNTNIQRLVFTSSVASLGIPDPGEGSADPKGRGPSPGLMDESHQFNMPPQRFRYGHSKLLAEGVVHEFIARGLDAVIVNPSVILGPGDLNLISGSIVTEVASGHVPPVYPPGGVNYIDVADVCAGHIAAAERGRPGERYILAAHNLMHKEAMQIVCEVVGVPRPCIKLPRALIRPLAAMIDLAAKIARRPLSLNGDQLRMSGEFIYFDSSKAVRELGLPQTPFRKTVERTYEWYKVHGYLGRRTRDRFA
jgi:dihydroflavonol-4-reductase